MGGGRELQAGWFLAGLELMEAAGRGAELVQRLETKLSENDK